MKNCLFCILFLFISVIAFSANSEDYTWKMEKGFGVDRNYDGRIDIPNTREYLMMKEFDVSFAVSDRFLEQNGWDEDFPPLVGNVYLHSETGEGYWGQGDIKNIVVKDLPLGKYQGSIFFAFKGELLGAEVEIETNRIVIAILGDSYSSGEGAPERKYNRDRISVWADGGKGSLETINHLKGHRSSLAWGTQAALYLEDKDPHSSVVCIFLAGSGARIDKGILGPHPGVDTTLGGDIPPQIGELEKIVGKEKIDYLFLSIGGNDLGFVPVVFLTLVYGDRSGQMKNKLYMKQIENLETSIETGEWQGFLPTLFNFNENFDIIGLNHLDYWYEKLGVLLKARFDIGQTILLEYPNPLAPGKTIMSDLVKGFAIDGWEAEFFTENVIDNLTEIQKEVCAKLGWTYASSFEEVKLEDHYYGARLPYPPSEYDYKKVQKPYEWNLFKAKYLEDNLPVTFFVTPSVSATVQGASAQGETPNMVTTAGTLHPNDLGYQLMMHQALRVVKLPDFFPSDFQKDYTVID